MAGQPVGEEHDWLKAAREAEQRRFAKRARPGDEPSEEAPVAKRGRVVPRQDSKEDDDWLKKLQASESKRFAERDAPRAAPRKGERRFEVGRRVGDILQVLVWSTEHDDLGLVPHIRWDGRWLESMPMQTAFTVDVKHTRAAFDALEHLGYKGLRYDFVMPAAVDDDRPKKTPEPTPPEPKRSSPEPLLPIRSSPPPERKLPPRGDKTYRVREFAPDYWASHDGEHLRIHLESLEYDDLTVIPYASWNGTWLESMPMQANLTVPWKHGNAALDAIEKLGYKGIRPSRYNFD